MKVEDDQQWVTAVLIKVIKLKKSMPFFKGIVRKHWMAVINYLRPVNLATLMTCKFLICDFKVFFYLF